MAEDLGKTNLGMNPNIAATLSYVLGWISGLVIYLLEKDNKYVRFHAMQSIVVFGAFTIIGILLIFIPVLGWMLLIPVRLISFVLWIICMIKAYQGEEFMIPKAGEFAKEKA
jgi:uncharacterized membrane protein